MKKMKSEPEDIKKMERSMNSQWIDDDPNVPPGWKTRTTDMKTKVTMIF